jgi:hypothetical protein
MCHKGLNTTPEGTAALDYNLKWIRSILSVSRDTNTSPLLACDVSSCLVSANSNRNGVLMFSKISLNF